MLSVVVVGGRCRHQHTDAAVETSASIQHVLEQTEKPKKMYSLAFRFIHSSLINIYLVCSGERIPRSRWMFTDAVYECMCVCVFTLEVQL